MIEVVIKDPDASQMAIDGLRLQPLAQKIICIIVDLVLIHGLDRDIYPQHEVLKDVHVHLDRVRGVIASLQEASVVHDHIADLHPSASFQ